MARSGLIDATTGRTPTPPDALRTGDRGRATLRDRDGAGLRGRIDPPAVLLLAAVLTVVVAALALPLLDTGGSLVADDIAQDGTAVLALAALCLGFRRAPRATRPILAALAASLALVGSGMIGHDLEPITGGSPPETLLFIASMAIMVATITPAISLGMPRALLIAAWLDALILLAAGLVLVSTAWTILGERDSSLVIVALGLLVLTAWTLAAAVLLFARDLRPGLYGPYAILAGVGMIAVSGLGWLARLGHADVATSVAATDFLFPVGALLVARGGLTWTLVADPTMRASRVLIQLRDFVPTGAIMAAVVMFVLVPPADDTAFIGAGFIRAVLVGGVVAAGIRQVLLKVYERRANEAERAAEERLAVEIRDRERVSRALAELEPGSSAAETAMGICTRCLELPGVGFAIVTGVDGSGEYTPIAAAGLDPHGLVGRRLSSEHAAHLTEGIAQGAWREAASPWLDAWVDPGGGAEVARVALRLEDHVIGVLTMGCRNHLDPAGIARRLSTVREIGVVAAALLGPALAADEAYRARRAAIDRVIEDQAFYPVYQPIVDLASGAVRGFEALTRFTDGTRPDLRFIEASAVGLGVELEIATLEAAAKGAASLPADCYLSVNLSPEIATRPEMLGPTLTRLPRDVLLELTEHVPVEDYESLMGCIYALDLRVRIAVDDAGSGYAGLQHILAVRPHVVKLDIALIRSVDIDLARQALVGSMVSFASMTGAVVVAEGVETEAEARMLQGLGVALGQGYFFGRPERAPALTDALATAGG